MSMITEEFGVIPPDVQTQMLIAPVLSEMIATQAFAIDEQFIVNSTLYKVTKAISIGDTISVGTGENDNCVLSDTIVQQIKTHNIYGNISASSIAASDYTLTGNITNWDGTSIPVTITCNDAKLFSFDINVVFNEDNLLFINVRITLKDGAGTSLIGISIQSDAFKKIPSIKNALYTQPMIASNNNDAMDPLWVSHTVNSNVITMNQSNGVLGNKVAFPWTYVII